MLALAGEAGIGKTELLGYALEQADGMRVLRTRGVESEAEVPFAALADLIRPALAAVEQLPAPQAGALSGALALGPSGSVERFAIGAATLSLLSAYADDGPLLLLIDDAHLMDRSSAAAILFAARRLVDDPVAMVIAVREGEASLLDGADLRVLRLAGLGRADAGQLLSGVAPEAVDRVFHATGGNPLALLELASAAPRLAAVPGDAPVLLSTSLTDAFARRLDPLAAGTRHLLLLAAAGGAYDLAVLARAGGDLRDLAPAEEARLVTLSETGLEFSHPLVRSAVYAAASPKERREAHAALAGAVSAGDLDRRAWHLSAAAVGPDAAASAELERAAGRAMGRSAYAVATGTYERAAQLLPGDGEGAPLLYAAADAAWLSGDAARTAALLDAARAQAPEPLVAAQISHLRGRLLLRRGPVADGAALLAETAEQVAGIDPELAVVMLAESTQGAFMGGNPAGMAAAAARAAELVDAAGSARARFFAEMAGAIALVAAGEGQEGAAHARRAVAILEETGELRDDPRLVAWAMLGPLYLRANEGRALIERATDQVRARGAAGTLSVILHYLARDQATTDQWPAAHANFDEAIRLAEEMGLRSDQAASMAGLAWLEARQGRAADCRAHAELAKALCDELGMGTYAVWAVQALGDLELGLGRVAESAALHEAQAALLREHGLADVDLSPAPELVDAYLRLGRGNDASAQAAAYREAAEAKGQPWGLARAARCRGMLPETVGWDAAFEEAIACHDRTFDVFERARTLLAYGARLRREQQRARSREQLRAALDAFERLGSVPWADQARAELAATGERARRRDPSTLDDLTPQEFQLAGMLARGMTTREVAAAVFLSPKTVEYHLRNTYRKLGIHSREELAAAIESSAASR